MQSAPPTDETRRPRGKALRCLGRRAALLAFPVMLLWLAYFTHGGDLGKWRDDYFQCMIDPEHGPPAGLAFPFKAKHGFWRPVHVFIVYNLGTVFWENDVARHLVTLAAAMLAIGMWWALCARLTRTRLAAAFGALLFACYPMAFEVAFWPAAISTALSTCVLAGILHICVSAAKSQRPLRLIALMAPLAFLGACLNEQPMAGLAPIGVFAFAVAPRGRPRRRGLTSAAACTVSAGLGCLAYIVPFAIFRPQTSRGGLETLAPAGDMPRNLAEALHDAWLSMAGQRMLRHLRETIEIAVNTIGAAWWVLIPMLLAAAAAWAVREPSDRAMPRSPRHAALVAGFGVLSALCMFLPICILESHNVAPRMTYAPAAVLGLAAAMLVDTCIGAGDSKHADLKRGVVVAILAATATLGAASLFGMQHVQHERAMRDRHLESEIMRLVPDPPPGAGFVVLKNQYGLLRTSDLLVNTHSTGIFGRRFSGELFFGRAYHRNDIFVGAHTIRGDGALLCRNSEWLYLNELERGIGKGGSGVSAADAIPMIFDEDGNVQFVSRMWVEREDHLDLLVEFPLGVEYARRNDQPRRTFVRPLWGHKFEPRTVIPAEPLRGWRCAPGAAVQQGLSAHGVSRPGIVARVSPGEGFASIAELTLPAAGEPRRILMRATSPQLPAGATLEVRWLVPQRGNQVLATVRLSPELLAEDPRWFPVRFNVAPGETPLTLRVEARLAADESAEVLLSLGAIQDLGPAGEMRRPTPGIDEEDGPLIDLDEEAP